MGKLAAMLDIELSYPNITPLLSAFTDVEFTPVVKCFSRSKKKSTRTELPPPDAGLLVFKVQPPLPSQVDIDETTGVIRGSPLMEHLAGMQYIVTACWEDSMEPAATCAVAFAVVPVDVASICNAAYLGRQEAPSFRSLQPAQLGKSRDMAQRDNSRMLDTQCMVDNVDLASHSPFKTSPDAAIMFVNGEDENKKCVDNPSNMGRMPFHSSEMPAKFTLPVHMQGHALIESKVGNKPHMRSLPPNWRAKYGPSVPLSLAGTSRTRVFPLGPPLRNRSCADEHRLAASAISSSSARTAIPPLLSEMYDGQEVDHSLSARRPFTQSGNAEHRLFRVPAITHDSELRAATAPTHRY